MVIEDTPSLEILIVVDQQGPTRINVFCTKIGSGGLLIYKILLLSGTTVALYLSFLISTLFLVLKMYVRLSSSKASPSFWAQ